MITRSQLPGGLSTAKIRQKLFEEKIIRYHRISSDKKKAFFGFHMRIGRRARFSHNINILNSFADVGRVSFLSMSGAVTIVFFRRRNENENRT